MAEDQLEGNEAREEGAKPSEPEKTHFMSPQTRNLLVGTALAIILLTITAWAGSVRTEKARRAALLDGVSALAAAMKYPMLEATSPRGTAGYGRLETIIADIATAGEYSAAWIAKPDGTVIATTRGDLEPKKIPSNELPSGGAKLTNGTAGATLSAPIKLSDKVVGYLFVEVPHG